MTDCQWVIVIAAIAVAALFAFGPTPKIWQRRIIVVRAAGMVSKEMWRAAWERGRNVWPEMERRAKQDV